MTNFLPEYGGTVHPVHTYATVPDDVPYHLVMDHPMNANADDAPWTTTAVRDEIRALLPSLDPTIWKPRDVVRAIMAVLNRHGYDSVDRELSFALAAATFGWDYDAMYDAWLEE